MQTGATTTLTALLDDVVISDPSGKMLRAWAFDDAAEVSDSTQSAAGKWARTAFSPIGTAASAHDTFSNEDGGCLLNTAPFTASNQYYEVSVLFPAADYSKHHATARVKLVAGGGADESCPAQAELFVVSPVPPLYPMAVGQPAALQVGAWQTLNLEVPEGTVTSEGSGSPTNSARIDQLGLRITTYPCDSKRA
jgi:hypothetical protein